MNDLVQLRKIVIHFEEVYHDGGPPPGRALVRAAIMAVARNPYAGSFVEDLSPLTEALRPLGRDLARRILDALGDRPEAIEGCGKGAIVGTAGEAEHGALWHDAADSAIREALRGTPAMVPSTQKVGGAGCRLDVPIAHIDASHARTHQDALEVGVADAPRPDEIVFVLAMATGGRIHARGGLAASDQRGQEGPR